MSEVIEMAITPRESTGIKINNGSKRKEEDEREAEPTGEGGFGYSLRNFGIAVVGFVVLLVLASFLFGWWGAVLVILIGAVMAAVIIILYRDMAPKDNGVTGDKEGTAKAIVVGPEESPKFVRIIMNYSGYELDQQWSVVPKGQGHRKKTLADYLDGILPGLFIVGIPGINRVYKYMFSWTSATEKGELVPKREKLDHIYVKRDIYIGLLKGAEVGLTFVPVNIQINITAKVTNPYKALFRVENWLEYIINIIKVLLRDFVGQIGQELTQEDQLKLKRALQEVPPENYRERERVEQEFRLNKALGIFVTGKKDLGDVIFEKLKDGGDLNEFKNDIGILILKVQTPDIDFGTFQELALKQFTAHQEGEAKVITERKAGEAYKARKKLEKEADMDFYQGVFSKVREFGDLGIALRFIEALQKAAEGPGNTIIPVGFMRNMASQIVGKESGDDMVKMLVAAMGGAVTVEGINKTKKALEDMEKGADKGENKEAKKKDEKKKEKKGAKK